MRKAAGYDKNKVLATVVTAVFFMLSIGLAKEIGFMPPGEQNNNEGLSSFTHILLF